MLKSILVFLLMATPGFCQDVAELLQKGIYTQQSVGDLDQAMRIYRQIINSGTDQRAVAAQAQFLLAQCLIRKGDLANAAQEFARLAQDYANYREVIGKLSREYSIAIKAAPPTFDEVEVLKAELDALRSKYTENHPEVRRVEKALLEAEYAARVRAPFATVQNGRYHHNKTGVEIDLPQGWSVRGTDLSSDNGEMAILSESSYKDVFAGVWMIPEQIRAENITARLRGAIPEKIGQRTDFHNYAMRPESIQLTTIGGRQAIRALADYDEGVKMTEMMAWIYTEKTRAFFLARVAADEFAGFQPRFEQIIQAAHVP